jgi:hypothetical protein
LDAVILTPEEAARQSWDAYYTAMSKWIELHRCWPDKPVEAAQIALWAWWEINEAVIAISPLGQAHNPLDHSAKSKPRRIPGNGR